MTKEEFTAAYDYLKDITKFLSGGFQNIPGFEELAKEEYIPYYKEMESGQGPLWISLISTIRKDIKIPEVIQGKIPQIENYIYMHI